MNDTPFWHKFLSRRFLVAVLAVVVAAGSLWWGVDEEAMQAVNTSVEDFVKNICLIDKEGNLIVAIVKGEDRVSTKKIGKVLGIERPRTADPQEILEKTGFICGGVPSFGYVATFLIDPKVMEKEAIYSGGGSEKSLVKISPQELLKANQGQVIKIRK